MENLNTDILGRLPLAVPPRDEQEKLVFRLKTNLQQFDVTRTSLSGSVNCLQEYRQSLITAAVTGQLDIEEAA
jgi:type I restriction enzyme S subunit